MCGMNMWERQLRLSLKRMILESFVKTNELNPQTFSVKIKFKIIKSIKGNSIKQALLWDLMPLRSIENGLLYSRMIGCLSYHAQIDYPIFVL